MSLSLLGFKTRLRELIKLRPSINSIVFIKITPADLSAGWGVDTLIILLISQKASQVSFPQPTRRLTIHYCENRTATGVFNFS